MSLLKGWSILRFVSNGLEIYDITNVLQRNPGFPCNQGQKLVKNSQSRHFDVDFQCVVPAFNKNGYDIWILHKKYVKINASYYSYTQ